MTLTVTEPEWDVDEREKMAELGDIERMVHHRCGMPLEDVLDPDNAADPDRRRPERYVAGHFPKVCYYCAVRDDRIEADRRLNEENKTQRAHPAALIWPVYDRGRDR